MDLGAVLLESWDRQTRIVSSVSELVIEANRHLRPSDDGMDLAHQLAHIHNVRHYFLGNVAPERAATIASSFVDGWTTPIDDLVQIKSLLVDSAAAVRDVTQVALESGTQQFGWYDHPVLFLQHMIWHEGWHTGLIFLALRRGGLEPDEAWEEARVWGEWRTETW